MSKYLLLIIVASIAMVSCKKEGCMDPLAVNYMEEAEKDDMSCNYAPFITLNGADVVTLSVGDVYVDAGAVASNGDGSAVPVATDASSVNTSVAGSYTVTYSATNEFGTSTASRTVNVAIGQSNWGGNWTVSSACGTSFPLNVSPTILLGAGADEITIDGMFSISIPAIPIILPSGLNIASGGVATATINGNVITVPNQTYDIAGIGSITYSGTGIMNSTGDQFTIDYTYNNTLPSIGGSGTCTATYTK